MDFRLSQLRCRYRVGIALLYIFFKTMTCKILFYSIPFDLTKRISLVDDTQLQYFLDLLINGLKIALHFGNKKFLEGILGIVI